MLVELDDAESLGVEQPPQPHVAPTAGAAVTLDQRHTVGVPRLEPVDGVTVTHVEQALVAVRGDVEQHVIVAAHPPTVPRSRIILGFEGGLAQPGRRARRSTMNLSTTRLSAYQHGITRRIVTEHPLQHRVAGRDDQPEPCVGPVVPTDQPAGGSGRTCLIQEALDVCGQPLPMVRLEQRRVAQRDEPGLLRVQHEIGIEEDIDELVGRCRRRGIPVEEQLVVAIQHASHGRVDDRRQVLEVLVQRTDRNTCTLGDIGGGQLARNPFADQLHQRRNDRVDVCTTAICFGSRRSPTGGSSVETLAWSTVTRSRVSNAVASLGPHCETVDAQDLVQAVVDGIVGIEFAPCDEPESAFSNARHDATLAELTGTTT